MQKQGTGGHIINFSSMAALAGLFFFYKTNNYFLAFGISTHFLIFCSGLRCYNLFNEQIWLSWSIFLSFTHFILDSDINSTRFFSVCMERFVTI